MIYSKDPIFHCPNSFAVIKALQCAYLARSSRVLGFFLLICDWVLHIDEGVVYMFPQNGWRGNCAWLSAHTDWISCTGVCIYLNSLVFHFAGSSIYVQLLHLWYCNSLCFLMHQMVRYGEWCLPNDAAVHGPPAPPAFAVPLQVLQQHMPGTQQWSKHNENMGLKNSSQVTWN